MKNNYFALSKFVLILWLSCLNPDILVSIRFSFITMIALVIDLILLGFWGINNYREPYAQFN